MKTITKTLIFLLGFSSIFALPEVDINTVRYHDYPEELKKAEFEKGKQFYADLEENNKPLLDKMNTQPITDSTYYCANKAGRLEEFVNFVDSYLSKKNGLNDDYEVVVEFNDVYVVRCSFLNFLNTYVSATIGVGLHIELDSTKMKSVNTKEVFDYDILRGNINYIMPAIKNNNLEIIKFFACQAPYNDTWAKYKDGSKSYYERTLLMAATYGTIEAYIVARECFFENTSMFTGYDKYDGYAYPVSFAIDDWSESKLEKYCNTYLDSAEKYEKSKKYYLRKYDFCKSGAFFERSHTKKVPITQSEHKEIQKDYIFNGFKEE
ncbi:MAG TPA: hypothetical protein PLY93_07035 [Turneriella sp.]|nr:hypothetical protein [Turneriella sp.]